MKQGGGRTGQKRSQPQNGTFFLQVKQRLVFFCTGRSSAAPASATAGLGLAEAMACWSMASPQTGGATSATGDALRAGDAISNGDTSAGPCEAATGELGWGWACPAAATGRADGAALGVRLSLRDLPAEALFCFAAWSSRLHCEHSSEGSFLRQRHHDTVNLFAGECSRRREEKGGGRVRTRGCHALVD